MTGVRQRLLLGGRGGGKRLIVTERGFDLLRQGEAAIAEMRERWAAQIGAAQLEEIEGRLADTADLGDANVRTVLQFGESVATLTKHNLLSAELVNDWLWVSGLWSRVGPAALRARENYGEPRLYENFEALANG